MRRIDLFLNRGFWAAGAVAALSLVMHAPEAEASARKREEASKAAVLTAETQVSLGRRFEARGDTETALGLYQQAVNEKPDNEEALRALVGLAVRTHRAGMVFDYAARLADRHPNDAEAQVWLATSLNERAQPQEALAALEQAEQAGGGAYAGQLWTQRGIAHDLAGNHPEAQRAFSHAITLTAGEWQLPMRLALSLALQGDYPAALRILQMQVNDPAMEQPVRETLAIIYGLSSQTDQAVEIARSATTQDLGESQRGYLALLPMLSAQGRAYAAHFRRINEALGTAEAVSVPPAPATPASVEPVAVAEPVAAPVEVSRPVPEPPASEPQAAISGKGYWLQLAALVDREKAATAWHDAVRRSGGLLAGREAFLHLHPQGAVVYHRLLTGPFETLAAARAFAAKLGAQGIQPVIKRDVEGIELLNR